MHNFSIVLYSPDIPGNTGTIGRTCVALDIRLILIKPYGFDITEKSVRRAGLDYWKYVLGGNIDCPFLHDIFFNSYTLFFAEIAFPRGRFLDKPIGFAIFIQNFPPAFLCPLSF